MLPEAASSSERNCFSVASSAPSGMLLISPIVRHRADCSRTPNVPLPESHVPPTGGNPHTEFALRLAGIVFSFSPRGCYQALGNFIQLQPMPGQCPPVCHLYAQSLRSV